MMMDTNPIVTNYVQTADNSEPSPSVQTIIGFTFFNHTENVSVDLLQNSSQIYFSEVET